MQELKSIPFLFDEIGCKIYHARKAFEVLGVSWNGMQTIYGKGLENEYHKKIIHLRKTATIYITEVGLFKLSAHGRNKVAKEYFKKVVDSYFVNFSIENEV